jgi:squalene-hopene/tetraprenyl-beta-curcumene cyclase
VRAIPLLVAVELGGLVVLISAGSATPPAPSVSWSPQTAAAYLDQRQGWWEGWPRAARDHGTVCVSCHTAVPYALVRPELRATLREPDTTVIERRLVADVVTRVRSWSEVQPFYGDSTIAGREKARESRGTEAVLNALILASRDQRAGVISADARQAFANMFALQQTTGEEDGAWSWLNFGLRPWESLSAPYYGAALAAIAVGMEPDRYAESPDIQPNVERLRDYLRTHTDQSLLNRLRRRDDPSLFNRAMLLWAAANLRTLLTADERRSIIADLWAAQEPDGSWRLAALGRWQQADGVPFDSTGDGYATGLVAYVLEQGGSAPNEPHLARALAWLAQHQDPATGAWSARSLNKKRDPSSNVGKFMSDAATAYAVLALVRATR